MCVDYRILNKITLKDNYPLPLIEDLIDKLANKTVFSLLDLKSAFYQVDMDTDSVKFTSFVTPLGQYEFLKMPFGFRNAPSVFQRFVNNVFDDMLRTGKVAIYLDNIMTATETIDEHYEVLKDVHTSEISEK